LEHEYLIYDLLLERVINMTQGEIRQGGVPPLVFIPNEEYMILEILLET
jgi:hypothetical protein